MREQGPWPFFPFGARPAPDRVNGVVLSLLARYALDVGTFLSLHKGRPKPMTMILTTLRAGPFAASLLGAALHPAFAADVTGTWLTEEGKATVRMSDCGGALCGTIVALKDPVDPATGMPKTDKNNVDVSKRSRPMIGVEIVLGMKPAATPNHWTGRLYNAEDGKTYSGTLTLQNANTIKLQGCILSGIICKSSLWTRAG